MAILKYARISSGVCDMANKTVTLLLKTSKR